MMFGGLFLSNDSQGAISDIKYLSFFHYAYEALMVNEFTGLALIFNPKDVGDFEIDGRTVLYNYGMYYENLEVDIYALVYFLVLFTALGYVLLAFTNSAPK